MQWLKWNSNVFACFMRDVVLELRPQSIEGPVLLYLNNWVSSVQLLSIQRLRNWVSGLEHYHCPGVGVEGGQSETEMKKRQTQNHTNYLAREKDTKCMCFVSSSYIVCCQQSSCVWIIWMSSESSNILKIVQVRQEISLVLTSKQHWSRTTSFLTF